MSGDDVKHGSRDDGTFILMIFSPILRYTPFGVWISITFCPALSAIVSSLPEARHIILWYWLRMGIALITTKKSVL